MVPEGDFPAVEAKDVLMPDGKRLPEALEGLGEGTVKSVNGTLPDENGNIEIEIAEQPTEVDITDFSESGIITETYEDGTGNTYTFVYDEETDSTTITDSEGNQTVVKGLAIGEGASGKDGFSPIVEVSEIEGGHRVTVTDKDGTETFDVMDGGSPTVAVEDIEGGHRVSITDAEGTQTFDVLDGTGSTAEILSGDTASVTPSAVATAVQEGKPVLISHIDATYGTLHFTDFSVAENYNLVAASVVFELFGAVFSASLAGYIEGGTWSFALKELATADDIPEEKTVTAVDLSGYESGTIVETYSDSTTLTYNLTFDADGNITKIVDSNGNETVITW